MIMKPHLKKESFWDSMFAYENATETTNAIQLKRKGITCLSIEGMSDEEVHKELWVVLEALGNMNVFLYNTDHLSDRELYCRLWTDTLQQEVKDVPFDKKRFDSVDLVGGGSEKDLKLMLRYYADDDIRRAWKEDVPDMPPKEKTPFQRDSKLPR